MLAKWKHLLAVLGLIAATSWLAVFSLPDKRLHLIACDVGQGDAILAVYGDRQILVDGGPGNKVIDCLDRHLPFWDRKIELVVLTHPQKDHFEGLIEVFNSYEVDSLVSSGLDSSSQEFQVLKNIVGGSGVKVINPTTGMVVSFGMIQLDIVWPTREFLAENTELIMSGKEFESGVASLDESRNRFANLHDKSTVLGSFNSSCDPNDFSVVVILSFGEFDSLLTGDIGSKIADEILATNRVIDVEYIKIPHHGSKNGLTKELLDAATPEVAVISVGKNSYGHPHKEVIKLLTDREIKILRTDEKGDVEVVSNGREFWVED